MKATATCIGLFVIVSASPARADDAEKVAMAHVRLTTEAPLVAGCTRLGLVRDDSVKDLRRKIVRAAGNAGLLSFRADDMSTIHAQVFRCSPTKAPPPGILPAPPGPPPPPPPAPSR